MGGRFRISLARYPGYANRSQVARIARSESRGVGCAHDPLRFPGLRYAAIQHNNAHNNRRQTDVQPCDGGVERYRAFEAFL